MLLQCASSAVDERPIFSVGGPKLSPERYILLSVEDILNVVVGKPVLGREETTAPRVKPLYGPLNFGPGGVRESVRQEPISEGLAELEPLVRGLKVPVVGRKTRGRVCRE